GTISPFLLTNVSPTDMPHGNADFLTTIDGGAMDKFAVNEGDQSMGYFDNSIGGIDLLWGRAQQNALADHYFASVLNDAPTNQLYLAAAADNNNIFSVQPAFGPCNQPDPKSSQYTFANVGDQMNSKGVNWTWFAENLGVCGSYVPQQNPFQYFT